MLIIPAIDLKDGRCVRLFQGDMDKETVYFENPVEAARHWVDEGATSGRVGAREVSGRSGNPSPPLRPDVVSPRFGIVTKLIRSDETRGRVRSSSSRSGYGIDSTHNRNTPTTT